MCALNLVSETTSSAHAVRAYGKPFSFATYEGVSHSTASFRLRIQKPENQQPPAVLTAVSHLRSSNEEKQETRKP